MLTSEQLQIEAPKKKKQETEFAFGFFVYGTLKPADRFRPKPDMSVNARIEGALYDLGAFPGLKLQGLGKVYGVIHLWKDPEHVLELVAAIDDYEAEGTLYSRYNLDWCDTTIFLYEYIGQTIEQLSKNGKIIESGIWTDTVGENHFVNGPFTILSKEGLSYGTGR